MNEGEAGGNELCACVRGIGGLEGVGMDEPAQR